MRVLLSTSAPAATGAFGSTHTEASGTVDLDAAYALPEPVPGVPHVRSNFVTSVDGAIEIEGRSGGLGGPADRLVFRTLRWLSDVVLVGAGTVRVEDYGPVPVPAERQERRVAEGLAAVPPVAVVSGRLDLDPQARLFGGAVRPLLLTSEAAPAQARRALEPVADIVICGERTVEPPAVLAALAARGLLRVLTEGGPSLHAQFAQAGLLDEACVTLAPVLAGPGRLGMMTGPAWATPLGLRLVHVLEESDVLFLRLARTPGPDADSDPDSAGR
ncbi:Pyrimidine reductase, riboflavin biosynthesis [Parafrankia irregularis]|uniref:Pyrimidine reductase, riboflavin biosynthesis n=1 Tax=Parafrankia irregularis TaxID=795642 RepID=A0A0S4QKI1_9ACTN|nr:MULTISPECIES: pyrimidine reductase family protein [Parafrankia]MBE3202031.1 pyrimidine reductase family protein [Parafrankia sp. CH37]CUU55806.1 Pyrimidine reductase, riboflavin biosynthesis [Parafrankia irregularis]